MQKFEFELGHTLGIFNIENVGGSTRDCTVKNIFRLLKFSNIFGKIIFKSFL